MSGTGTLAGKVCLVTGASRGIGRGVALQLGSQGATVYITGRTLTNKEGALSLTDTAREITRRGGKCIPVKLDHGIDEEVDRLFQQIDREQDGQLDILVNNAFSAFKFFRDNMDRKFWEMDISAYDEINLVGLRNHYRCTVLAARLMVPRKRGLIVTISDQGAINYALNVAYGIGKEGLDRMMSDCGFELRDQNIACISLWPCLVKTEDGVKLVSDPVAGGKLAKGLGVSKELLDENYKLGESTEFVGKCIVHIATDTKVMRFSGKSVMTGDLCDIYGFRDDDGGHKPFNTRRINSLLGFAPKWISWLKWVIPDCVKIPTFFLGMTGNKLY